MTSQETGINIESLPFMEVYIFARVNYDFVLNYFTAIHLDKSIVKSRTQGK